jgi:cytosine/adenosine deaminase-related metal-dependent hydrolase
MNWEIKNAKIVSENRILDSNISIDNDKISSISTSHVAHNNPVLDAEGLFVYPGLINSHDHLLGSYSPAILESSPYLSWLSWDNALKSSIIFSERQILEPELLYQLGAYKNILGGCTTVVDHIPHFVNQPFLTTLPIRILKDYTLSHSIGDYSLGWGDGPALEYQLAEKKKIPFITHIGEGLDDDSASSFRLLEKWNALGEYTVLVHGIPFGTKEIAKIKQAKANVVWCPRSNLNLFHKTSNIKQFLDAGVPISLGTDLALTGTSNIFDEMKKASSYYSEQYSEELPAQEIFKMVTLNPARAFCIGDQLGSIEKGKKADFLILPKKFDDPYQNLLSANSEDIVLVVKDGLPIFADIKLEGLLSDLSVVAETIYFKNNPERSKLLIGSPKKLFKSIQSALGYKKDLAFLPILE